MLKVVVFDGGYGGELFADKLETELPIVKVIRVIDWRSADRFLKNSRAARQAAKEALRPYIGRVDLIIFANYFLSATSLKYFRRKFKNQNFLGLKLPYPTTFIKRPTFVLTTRALAHTISYQNYKFRLNRPIDTLCLDSWVGLIDDGELTVNMVYREFEKFRRKNHCLPNEVILTSSQFNDIIPQLREVLGGNIKIYESSAETISETCKLLKIRGGTGKKKK
ncbi:hypothetical protein IJI18_00080 [Candidatus Saccharibacteria bacterium]|nr:hypothetical protein [Candidatus Saccharibacteria bacterium]MBQ6409645.1 hypothetical protein [Candidatus Saccharibacteria bacterium]MBR0423925.1 hypothetical protein [Candidatus Saccharibacteria bacterium]